MEGRALCPALGELVPKSCENARRAGPIFGKNRERQGNTGRSTHKESKSPARMAYRFRGASMISSLPKPRRRRSHKACGASRRTRIQSPERRSLGRGDRDVWQANCQADGLGHANGWSFAPSDERSAIPSGAPRVWALCSRGAPLRDDLRLPSIIPSGSRRAGHNRRGIPSTATQAHRFRI